MQVFKLILCTFFMMTMTLDVHRAQGAAPRRFKTPLEKKNYKAAADVVNKKQNARRWEKLGRLGKKIGGKFVMAAVYGRGQSVLDSVMMPMFGFENTPKGKEAFAHVKGLSMFGKVMTDLMDILESALNVGLDYLPQNINPFSDHHKALMELNRLELTIEELHQTGHLVDQNYHLAQFYITNANQYWLDDKGSMDYVLKILRIMVDLPTKNTCPHESKQVIKALNDYLKTYDPVLAKELRGLAYSIFANSVHASKIAKMSYFFIGAAGTGKTAVAKFIANTLNVPTCTISASDLTMASFIGDKGQEGRLSQCLTKPDNGKKGKNMVIFIDEVHDILNSSHGDAQRFYGTFKQMTEADQKTIRDEGTGIYLDISNVTFIFAANKEFTYDPENALKSRLITVKFPAVLKEHKWTIAVTRFEHLMNGLKLTITQKDMLVLEELVHLDACPGVRVLLKTIQNYVLFRKSVQDGFGNEDEFDLQGIYRNYAVGQQPKELG